MNSIVESSYPNFRKKLIDDSKFQKKLVEEIFNYQNLAKLGSVDSVTKYISIERMKEKEVYGMLYTALYRINNILFKTEFIFNKNEKIIQYKGLSTDE